MDQGREPGHFDQCTVGAEITFEHGEPADRRQRRSGKVNDRPVRPSRRPIGLGDCGSGDRQAAAV